ncbi:MAG: carbohydrate ABC transporter permease, partial [Oscillospiraceae bacterium]|nr:carbohydrate ABC transporter permease [Oscillospiraceae bacterium]
MKKKRLPLLIVKTVVAGVFALLFLMPTILTLSNSFMSQAEISANYGVVFGTAAEGAYMAERVNLKLIPDMVTFRQYSTVLIQSPYYLTRFWNSVVLVVPIVILQVLVAALAAYSFTRFRTKRKEVLFFAYIILMLMPFQVTLVPNYLMADFLGILDTRRAIWLPGIVAPFSVFLLTKFMRRIPISYIEAAKLDGAGEWR